MKMNLRRDLSRKKISDWIYDLGLQCFINPNEVTFELSYPYTFHKIFYQIFALFEFFQT